MNETQTRPWDAADYLETDEDVVAYLEAAFDDGDAGLIAANATSWAEERGAGLASGQSEACSTHPSLLAAGLVPLPSPSP